MGRMQGYGGLVARQGAASRTAAIVAAGLLAAGSIAAGANGATTTNTSGTTTAASSAAKACGISAGSVTAAGDHRIQSFLATKPITRTENRVVAQGIHPAGQPRLTSRWEYAPAEEGGSVSHEAVIALGNVLYDSGYLVPRGGGTPYKYQTVIGGGWGPFTAVEHSEYTVAGRQLRVTDYGLRSDGTLFRWNVTSTDGKKVRHPSGSASGFGAVKSMALFSQTATYDTFLVNLRGGGLYTVRIPTTSPMKPIVKKVRTSTWQGFETMLTARCGNYGSLLLGIDKDTGSGYLYAVGHATGASTVIQGLGKVPGTFTDPVNFTWHSYSDPLLFGE